MTASKPTLPVMLWNIVSLNRGWFARVLGAANAFFPGPPRPDPMEAGR